MTGVIAMLHRVLLAALCCSATAAAVADCRDWRAVRETAEGTLLHRCRPGSAIDEVMIVSRVAAAPQRLYALVNDYGAFAEFIPDVAESRVLAVEGDIQWVYHRLHFAGPVADRVYVMRSKATAADPPAASWRVEWTLSDRPFPQLDLAAGIRPDSLSGYWEIAGGTTADVSLARYAVHTDPGGHVPAWLVTRLTDRYVQRVVAAVRRRLED